MIKKITLLTLSLLLTFYLTAFAGTIPSALALPTQVVLVLSTAGATGKMAGVQVTVTLPAGVAVQADPVTGEVISPTLTASGGWAGGIVVARYTPATATAPGTVRIAMMNTAGADPGEFARLTCDVTDGSSTYPSSFPLSGVIISDLNGLKVFGGTVSLAFSGPAPVDTDPPALTISTLADGAVTNNSTLNVSGSVTDAGGVRSLTINSVPVTPDFSGHFSHALQLAGGANTIMTIATDNANNQTSDVRTITLNLTAPLLTITAPADNSKINRTSVDVTGSVDETSTVNVKVNGVSAQTVNRNGNSFSTNVNLSSGSNTITITATDLAGNVTSAIRTITSDTGAPSLAVTNPAQDITTNQSSITLSGTVADALTAVIITVSVDGQSYTPPVTSGAFSQTINFSAEKTYAVMVTATDEAGNQATVQRNIIYKTGKPGDCDGDGSVSIAEVQSSINMFLGLKLVAGCVDVDDNSSVSIAEVQKTINSFLGL